MTETPGAGTFPWTTAEIEEELAETREAWKAAKYFGWPTDGIERIGRNWANALTEAKANGGYILI